MPEEKNYKTEWSFSFEKLGSDIGGFVKSLGIGDEESIKEGEFSAPLDGAQSAKVRIDFSVGKCIVRPLTNLDNLIEAELTYVGDINFAVGNESNYVQVGIDNIGEGDDLNLMLGIGDLRGFSFRAGIHRSELGVGASWWDPAGIGLEATLYDLNDPKFNTYGHIPIGDSVDVVIGVDDLADEAVPTLGLGWKW